MHGLGTFGQGCLCKMALAAGDSRPSICWIRDSRPSKCSISAGLVASTERAAREELYASVELATALRLVLHWMSRSVSGVTLNSIGFGSVSVA